MKRKTITTVLLVALAVVFVPNESWSGPLATALQPVLDMIYDTVILVIISVLGVAGTVYGFRLIRKSIFMSGDEAWDRYKNKRGFGVKVYMKEDFSSFKKFARTRADARRNPLGKASI